MICPLIPNKVSYSSNMATVLATHLENDFLSNEAKRLEEEAKIAMADAKRQAEFNLQLMKRYLCVAITDA